MLLHFGKLVPHYPGIDVIKPASIPPPPLLTGDREQDALTCFRAYLATATHFFGAPKPRHTHLRELYALPRRSFRPLALAAELLFESHTQPMAWVAFSMQSHAQFGPTRWRSVKPSVAWVFQRKRMERDDPYVWFGGSMQGSKLIMSKTHTRLITRWERMRAQLLHAHQRGGLTAERVSSIVRVSLPPETYRKLVRSAITQARETQETITTDYECGVYLWG